MNVMWRRARREPMFTREEINGLIALLMSIEEGVNRIANAVDDENGREPEE